MPGAVCLLLLDSVLQKMTLIIAPDFPHDHARSRAFRWGEDGIAGVSDTHGLQNIALSFWNEEEYIKAVTRVQMSDADLA